MPHKSKLTDAERFWGFVDKNGPVPAHCPELGPCWIWTGSTTRGGYGKMKLSGTRECLRSNRLVFFFANGKFPEHFACHRCDNPPCCNPSHIFDGTAKRNVEDMIERGRRVILRGEDAPMARFTDKQVMAIRRSTKRVGELAVKYKTSTTVISNILSGKTWSHLPEAKEHTGKRRLGEMNGSAKLTREQAVSIRNSSLSGKQLAAMYGVSDALIYHIKSNKIWKEAEVGNA